LIAARRCQIVGDWQRRRVGAEVDGLGLVWFLCEIEIARDDVRGKMKKRNRERKKKK
jgi:hypothetical protein